MRHALPLHQRAWPRIPDDVRKLPMKALNIKALLLLAIGGFAAWIVWAVAWPEEQNVSSSIQLPTSTEASVPIEPESQVESPVGNRELVKPAESDVVEPTTVILTQLDGAESDYFKEKYQGYSTARLRSAYSDVHEQCVAERARILAERMSQGLFETEIVPAGDKRTYGGVSTSKAQPRIAFGGRATPLADGLTQVTTTQIVKGAYPEFDLLDFEDMWLERTLLLAK